MVSVPRGSGWGVEGLCDSKFRFDDDSLLREDTCVYRQIRGEVTVK